eukprot:CAMPEP_0178761658 /NCGR_PEP_ID=MMETSP0744-20121128/16127_1 /TAXON_ID=913974 /ORGANISM="Nitzschia punctata, Strain CCMP561" /LENGTH=406 /DNA_ID=CAMNT_0020416285 /DNA_START=63 /DNA_END=1283 /DNA_ORIENTATION=+
MDCDRQLLLCCINLYHSWIRLAGVACLGLALGILGSKLLEAKEDRNWHEDFAKEYEALTLFDHSDSYGHYDSDDDYDSEERILSEANRIDQEESCDMPTSSVSQKSTSTIGDAKQNDKTVTFSRTVKDGNDDGGASDGNDIYMDQQAETSVDESNHSNRRQSAKLIDSRKSNGLSLTRFFILLVITSIFAYLIGYQSGWSIWNTVYYAVISAATIGYGDLSPHTQEERFLAIIFIPLACAVTGHCLAYFANWIIEMQGAKFRKSTFDSHNELTLEDLRVMDITGDGKVAWFEFLEFMLVAMKKVDPDLLDELRDYFDRLDVSKTGELSKADLIEMARRKIKSPKRKLELYSYKQKLLELSHESKQQQQQEQPIYPGWIANSLGFLGVSNRNILNMDGDKPHNDAGN